MKTIVRKVKDAQPMGQYRATPVDAAKAAAEFRVTAVGSKNTIVWANGATELVTDHALEKLQSKHTWSTDF